MPNEGNHSLEEHTHLPEKDARYIKYQQKILLAMANIDPDATKRYLETMPALNHDPNVLAYLKLVPYECLVELFFSRDDEQFAQYQPIKEGASDDVDDDVGELMFDSNECAFRTIARSLSESIVQGEYELIDYVHGCLQSETSSSPRFQTDNPLLQSLQQAPLTPTTRSIFTIALSNIDSTSRENLLISVLRHRAIQIISDPLVDKKIYHQSQEMGLIAAYTNWSYQRSMQDAQNDVAIQKSIKIIGKQYLKDPSTFKDLWKNKGPQYCNKHYAAQSTQPERYQQWLKWFSHVNNSFINDNKIAKCYSENKAPEDSALLLQFDHIRQKLESAHYLSLKEFMHWWQQDGKETWFAIMRQSESSSDRHTWGKENEFAVLMFDLKHHDNWHEITNEFIDELLYENSLYSVERKLPSSSSSTQYGLASPRHTLFRPPQNPVIRFTPEERTLIESLLNKRINQQRVSDFVYIQKSMQNRPLALKMKQAGFFNTKGYFDTDPLNMQRIYSILTGELPPPPKSEQPILENPNESPPRP